MQTFLPYPSFDRSAKCLDRLRLGKQRVEVLQILRAIHSETNGWKNHPAVLMWESSPGSLISYGCAVCIEWRKRGYKDSCYAKIIGYVEMHPCSVSPFWLGEPDFHASHRSNLLRKDPGFYGQYGWTEPDDLPYVWPVQSMKSMKKEEVYA